MCVARTCALQDVEFATSIFALNIAQQRLVVEGISAVRLVMDVGRRLPRHLEFFVA